MQLARLILVFAVLLPPNLAYAASGQPLPAKAWQRKAVSFSIGIYYLKLPEADPAKAARALATDKRFALKVVEKPDKTAQSQALLGVKLSSNVASEYAPPNIESLHYFGHSLSSAQAQALQRSPRALILGFAHPGGQSNVGLRRAEAFVLELARREGGIIYDDETREAFTPEAWEAIRLKTWDGETPDVAKQIVIHAYNSDGRTRAISLGMARFGAPDLVINDTVWSLNRPLGHTINAVAQQVVESGPPDDKGMLQLKIAGLRHARLRKELMESLLPGGKGEGQVHLVEAEAEAGDPDNVLAALSFDAYPGRQPTERQVSFVTAVFGAQPSEVVYVKHNAALLAASNRARAQLPSLQKAFQRGLAPGERLEVKAPFATADGNSEWMWIEVTEWKGDRIRGMLRSAPRNVPEVKAGQMVDARQSEVFDYLRVFADGHTEGNETSKLLK